jgi:transposase
MEADADLLIGYVSKHFPQQQVQCCYECCCCGYHIYHSLTAAGWQVLVVNPGDIPRGNKQVAAKSDKVDSAHLVGELEAGRLKGILACQAMLAN